MTLSALNAHELPGIVELAGELGGVESLWVQPMIITHESLSHLKQYVFTEIPRNTLAQYINAAYEVSKRNGVRVDMMGSISDYAFSDESPDKPDIDYAPYTPACNYLWNGNLQVDESGMIRRVCCYISKEGNNEIINKYGLLKNYKDYYHFYNSKSYWQLRKDFVEGKCIHYCGSCPVGYSNYIALCNGSFPFTVV